MSETALDIVVGFAHYHKIKEAGDAEVELAALRAENARLRKLLEQAQSVIEAAKRLAGRHDITDCIWGDTEMPVYEIDNGDKQARDEALDGLMDRLAEWDELKAEAK